jgi:hypothetical protein
LSDRPAAARERLAALLRVVRPGLLEAARLVAAVERLEVEEARFELEEARADVEEARLEAAPRLLDVLFALALERLLEPPRVDLELPEPVAMCVPPGTLEVAGDYLTRAPIPRRRRR